MQEDIKHNNFVRRSPVCLRGNTPITGLEFHRHDTKYNRKEKDELQLAHCLKQKKCIVYMVNRKLIFPFNSIVNPQQQNRCT